MCNDDGGDGDGGSDAVYNYSVSLLWAHVCHSYYVCPVKPHRTEGHTHNEHSKQFHLLLLNTMIVIAPHKFERIASSSSTNNACIHKCFLINF